MKRPPKTASKLSEPVRQCLSMYALAARAAGVGVLALAQPADAKIVYTPAHKVISANTSFAIDLLNNGSHEFLVSNIFRSSVGAGKANAAVEHAYLVGRGFGTYAGAAGDSQGFARALRANRRVGPALQFQSTAGLVQSICQSGKVKHSGPWQNVRHRYLGLRFFVDRQIHYGWARLDVRDSKCKITATLTGYAYETIPDKPILAGKTRGTDGTRQAEPLNSTAQTAPAPASLGLLALGTPGLSIWRRDESLETVSSS